MVGALAGLTKLRDLCVGVSPYYSIHQFRELEKRQSLHSPYPDHVVFPALTKFQFRGDSEYLEDLVAFIDAPRLEDLNVEYAKNYDDDCFEEVIEAGNISQFISRTDAFKHPSSDMRR